MFKRARKELAKQAIATKEFDAAASDEEEEQYLGASSDSEIDDDDLVNSDFEGDGDVEEEEVDLKEIIRQTAEESGDEIDLDDEDALKKLIEEEGLADLDDGEDEFEDDEEQGSDVEIASDAELEDNEEDSDQADGIGSEEEQEEEGDMIYSCKICPHRVLKNEKAVEVHLEGKEHNRRLRYLQKQGVEDADEPKSKGSESKKAKKKEALAKRKESKKEEKRLKEKERRKALKKKKWEREQQEKAKAIDGQSASSEIPTANTKRPAAAARNSKPKKAKTQ
ncbi:hypothetical protein INT43_008367 [Umbelopsis isabellina]|uniref:Uncharacterized protein n=1 Tax=Mortierella isabellina TaxID=91625 RepID=A0A8H7PD05_MORIS|nr:hypothetical protein INT43_008367 [Umbelopsis isabellina]